MSHALDAATASASAALTSASLSLASAALAAAAASTAAAAVAAAGAAAGAAAAAAMLPLLPYVHEAGLEEQSRHATKRSFEEAFDAAISVELARRNNA